ncbi:MAG: alpha-amylase family glycosyl hydrolase [Polyangiaceae bacterium]|nr:alpha-amylase family glycosyl hydrolase [Polyangiaceae bacterium]
MNHAFPPKPTGWWTHHPTLLNVSVHGAYDSNGDGLGDFEGVRQKLDFFLEAGIAGYRFQHVGVYGNDPEWSGLVQQDWFQVDPHYGSMVDFERLMAACAERDVKVIMMAVPEYVGWQHPLYLKAKEAKQRGGVEAAWFEWNDDGTAVTCWDRPAPDCSNREYFDAFLGHLGFWMEKGIAGFDADAVPTWHNITPEVLRRFTSYVKERGGFVTAENFVLEKEVLRNGGFNAGTGRLRHEFYNELEAITQHKAEFIRDALKVRAELIKNGMFPYQQFGDVTHAKIFNSWACHRLEMFKLQVAFNAVLPDQVWLLAAGLTFTERVIRRPEIVDLGIDWPALEQQAHDPDSAFSHVKRLFALRARRPELGIGHIEEVATNCPEEVFAAIRYSEDLSERALVVFNFSDEKRSAKLQVPDLSGRTLKNYLSQEVLSLTGAELTLDLQLFGYKLLQVIS